MVKLQYKNNHGIVTVGDISLFFSYDTCVGYAKYGQAAYFTDKKYSKITSSHINEWMKLYPYPQVIKQDQLAVNLKELFNG